MERIKTIWKKNLLGKIGIGLTGLLISVCMCLGGLVAVGSRLPPVTPTVKAAQLALANAEILNSTPEQNKVLAVLPTINIQATVDAAVNGTASAQALQRTATPAPTAKPVDTATPTIVIAPTVLVLPTLDTRQIATPTILPQPTNVAATATSEINPTQTPNAQATLAAKMTQSPTYPTPVPQARVVVSNGERVSVETEPYDSGVRIAYLGPSDEAVVIGRSQDSKWLQVQVNGLLGWVESVSVKVVTGEIKYADVTWFASQKIAPVPVATSTRLVLPTAIPPAPTRAIVPTAIPTLAPTRPPSIAPAPQPPSQQPGQRYGAICRDGTQSGATGSGACSHHGGVAQWLVRP